MTPTLVVLRGNSGSGKSTIARMIQAGYGRGCALVEQDYLRRTVLRELGKPDGLAPLLVGHTARFALDHGLHLIVEGILHTPFYGEMLRSLVESHRGPSHVFYFDVSFEETVRRHASRPEAENVSPTEMREWYHPHDVLGVAGEHIIGDSPTLRETMDLIVATSGLAPPAEVP